MILLLPQAPVLLNYKLHMQHVVMSESTKGALSLRQAGMSRHVIRRLQRDCSYIDGWMDLRSTYDMSAVMGRTQRSQAQPSTDERGRERFSLRLRYSVVSLQREHD